ncbi:hypothetical protein BY996DRAFT_1650673 [Phakopsora pachyrhizi]|nr:hypothetical protein BY996DRAFT_1650673 [Phakopsora pachyrhizi]
MQTEVPDFISLLKTFSDENSFKSYSAVVENEFPEVTYDWFFCHLILFHILKSQIKFSSEGFVQRVTQELKGFEKVLGLFISKMELIQAIGHLRFYAYTGFQDGVMNYIEWIEFFLHRANTVLIIRDFNEIKELFQKKFTQQEILHIIFTWKEKIVSSAKALKDVKEDCNHYMYTVGKSNDRIQTKWMNSNFLKKMRAEFEAQKNVETFTTNLVKFIEDWATDLQAAEKSSHKNLLQ